MNTHFHFLNWRTKRKNKAQEEKYKSLYQSKLCIQVSEEPLCSVRMKKGQKLTLWFVRVLTRDLKNVFGGNTK